MHVADELRLFVRIAVHSEWVPTLVLVIGQAVLFTSRRAGRSSGVRRRALSNCYLKIAETLQFGRPESRGLRRLFQFKAVAADLTNLPNVLRMRPAGRRPLPASSWLEGEGPDVERATGPGGS
jgi:hypothetical protein